MKKIQLFIICLMIGGAIFAQAPQSFKYQAVARNAQGVAIANSPIGLQISIVAGNVNGEAVYSETFTANSNASGVFNVDIGTGNVVSGNFSGIDWGSDSYFLKVAMDANGGTNYTEMGTSQLLSVPYSLYTASIYVNYSNDTLYIGDQYVVLTGGGGGGGNTVTDYDGNSYETVTIGNQIWLKQNLRSLHYADGTPIDSVWVYDDNESNAAIWGRLYSWDAAMNGASSSNGNPSGVQGACPDGWHLPSKAEFDELISFVGSGVGWKLKETGNTYWDEPNSNTNETGFSARGSGGRNPYLYVYNNLKGLTNFWSATEQDNLRGKNMILYNNQSGAPLHNNSKGTGYSVRCIKD